MLSGTSMSTGVVSGIVALMLEANRAANGYPVRPSLTPTCVRRSSSSRRQRRPHRVAVRRAVRLEHQRDDAADDNPVDMLVPLSIR